ncbi:unnamed protein product [Paramecium pentaurelia]|uniref:MORN repeat protein n=1 Tax=Paramecium pentaurelia TaxID=43138 RepID=A0A8S1RZ97_9CILI|nr:unnamed protein product [Paramecium pentaurelia]
MNQQISQEYFIQKFASLHLSETDDDTSRSQSPVLDSRLIEFLSGLPVHIKQKLENFKPSPNFQFSKQNDESIYFGLMEGGLKHGIGIQLWPKIGNLLKGTWQNDLLEGVCTMFYFNGDIFEAYFLQGTTNGFGMFKSEKKVVKGIWINNQLQGEGQELKNDGTTYFGQFWNSRKQGRGIQMFPDGCKYEGFFQNNKFEGDGIFTWSDGSYYQGQFHKGLIRGFGFYNNNNGLQLIGHFQEIKKTDTTDQNLNKNLQTITFQNQYNQTLRIEKIRNL